MNAWAVRLRKKLSRISLLVSIRLIMLLTKAMPYRLGIHIGGMLGYIGYYILPRERKRALSHLAAVFRDQGDGWIRRTARRSFAHLGKSLLEVMLATPEKLASIGDFDGIENLTRAMAQGKGVIYVTGHIGNWELCGGMIAARFPLSVVAAPLEPEPLNDLVLKLRNSLGIKIILRGRAGSSRDLIRIFKENRVLGLLIDQDTDVEGTFVDFMGRPAWTPTAAASMAIRFGAPVVFGSVVRGRDNRHILTVEGPLDLTRTGDDARDIVANTALFTKKIEESILKNPEQWVWMHRRWRRQP